MRNPSRTDCWNIRLHYSSKGVREAADKVRSVQSPDGEETYARSTFSSTKSTWSFLYSRIRTIDESVVTAVAVAAIMIARMNVVCLSGQSSSKRVREQRASRS